MTDNLDNLRSIEGFPKGKDEDLLALSNPPYYTAYPNPHIEDFIRQYGKPYDEASDDYHREPFVSDVSEGKGDPIYNAHSYHTKVPPRAIVPFIEHYTNPGEIVFDGFCGTGMVGVAAQLANRATILNDLSTAATHIANSYNNPRNRIEFEKIAKILISEVISECEWLYSTKHVDGSKGKIKYTIWSEVFCCPYCGIEFPYWEIAVDKKTGRMTEDLKCPNCNANVTKRDLKRVYVESLDPTIKKIVRLAKFVPVQINYSTHNKRYDKVPDKDDLSLIAKINDLQIPYWFPTNPVPDGDKTGEALRLGITHVHHFYTKRNLWVLSCINNKIQEYSKQMTDLFSYAFTGMLDRASKMYRWNPDRPTGTLPGTLYFPSLGYEFEIIDMFERRINATAKLLKEINGFKPNQARITTQSVTNLPNIRENTIDYIFTDPPFGDNLMYSELNFVTECWLKASSNNNSEAIINKTQRKDLDGYRGLMTAAFSEMHRVLKPGRWITVEFHNSKASVWNAIQDALSRAGFVVAQVTVLDKGQGSFNQVTAAGAVKNDLVINAYKSRAGFSQQLISEAGRGLEADFVREHLHQLPLAANIERTKEMLFSKYLAYYVQHGYQVMYNGEQFYQVLSQWGFEERDSYWFADETQVNEYEKRKAKTFGKGGIQAQAVLFVSDERSARQWIWNFLDQPKTYDEIYTDFLKALQTSEDEIPEVKTILEESFVRTNGHWKRPDQLTQAELEKKRQERLLRQFEEYLSTAKANQKLKEVRLEAVIAGFTECYRSGRYKDILLVGKKLDKGILENSSDLYDFIDIAEAKVEG